MAKRALDAIRHRAAVPASLQHPHPGQVADPLFQRCRPFFDARDLVQVKYEMLRAHHVDRGRVVEVARRFGLSRQTFYVTDAAFHTARLRGLLPDRPGPKGPHKVTPELARFLRTQHRAHPEVDYRALAEAAATKFGIRVHPRTVRRVLAKRLFSPTPNAPRRRRR